MIESKRGNRIGIMSENDKADTIVFAAANEVGNDLFDGIDAAHSFTVWGAEVRRLHGLRDIEREHQVASRLNSLYRWLYALRASQREDDQNPADGGEDFLQPVALGYDSTRLRGDTHCCADVLEEAEPEGTLFFLVSGQQPVDEQRERQQCE